LPALAGFAHESVGELLIGGIDEHLPVDQNPHRQLVGGPSDPFEKLPPLVRIHGVERVRDAVAFEDIPGLVRAPRPPLADDAIVRLVTLSELALNPLETSRVVVDGQDHRPERLRFACAGHTITG
jgi:hypothetical protein